MIKPITRQAAAISFKRWAAVGLDLIVTLLLLPFVLVGFVAGLVVVVVKLIAASVREGYARANKPLEQHDAVVK